MLGPISQVSKLQPGGGPEIKGQTLPGTSLSSLEILLGQALPKACSVLMGAEGQCGLQMAPG